MKKTLKRKKIAVVGGKGKMGSAVCKALASDYDIFVIQKENKLLKSFDMVVDFGSSESSVHSAVWCKENGVPLIIGATGQSESDLKQIEEASKFVPIVLAQNFSEGLVLMKKALKSLITNETEDVIIFEKHHKEKKDSPSGTAKNLKQFIGEFYAGDIQMICERGGKEIGTHTVDCYFDNEMVSITHKAFSRDTFADGVKKTVAWMFGGEKKQNKLYSFDEICLIDKN